MSSLPLQFLIVTIAGWMTRDQHKVIAHLLAENAVLRAQLRGKRIRFSDAQRRKLASAAKALGRTELARINTLVTPETLLRWYGRLVANKYDGSAARAPATRRKTADIVGADLHPEGTTWFSGSWDQGGPVIVSRACTSRRALSRPEAPQAPTCLGC